MPQVIVPVGYSMGSGLSSLPGVERDWTASYLRIGDVVVEVTAAEYLAWALTRLDVEGHEHLRVDRAALVAALGEVEPPVPDAGAVVAGLVDGGVLLEYDTDGDLEPVFKRYRLVPLGDGAGATSDEPDLYWIERSGEQLVGLPLDLYILWAFSGGFVSLWDTCTHYAVAAAGDASDELTAHDLARRVADVLPLLVATGCSGLDPVSGP